MWKFIVLPIMMAANLAYASLGAVATSTAEAGRASVEASDAAYLNPAVLPYLKGYYFTTGYSTMKNSENQKDTQFSLSLIDNLPDTVIPTALAFTQSKNDFTSNETTSNDFRLSFANYMTKSLAGGVTIRYRDDKDQQERFTQTNLNLATLYSATSNLSFAAVLENVLGNKDEAPEETQLRPTTAFGMNYIYRRRIRGRFDVISAQNNSFDRPVLGAGLETYMNKWIILRMGVQRNNELAANAYSAGLGFVGPHFGIHYAYFQSPEQESLTRHALDLAVPIW